MMTALRKNMKIILIIVIFFFVAFIFLQWGMNITSSNSFRDNEQYVGEVAGVKITNQMYSSKIAEIRQNYLASQNKSSLSSREERMIREQAFGDIVDNIILKKIQDQYGYFTTEDEIVDIIMNVPPRSVREDERFYTEDGQFDLQLYQQIISDPANKQMLNAYYRQIRQQLPTMKLQSDIISGISISSDEMLRKIKINENKFRLEYIVIPNTYNKPVNAGNDEARSFYSKNREQFYRTPKASIEYISVEKEPSPQDILMAKENIEGLREDIVSGNYTFEEAAELYSADYQSARNEGSLGYIKRGETVEAFEEEAFNLNEGDLSKPVKTDFGWHLIRVNDKRRDSVNVSHILIQTEPSYETSQSIYGSIEPFVKDAKKMGFREAVGQHGYEVHSTAKFNPENDYIFELGGYANAVCNFIENAKEGSISSVIEMDNSFVVCLITEKTEEGIPPFEEISDLVKNRMIREKRRVLSSMNLNNIRNEIRESGMTLRRYASVNNLDYNRTGMITANDTIDYIEDISKLYGAVMASKPDSFYYSTDYEQGYIFRLIEMEPVNLQDNEELVDKYRNMIINEKQQMFINAWQIALRDIFEIKDYRY
ncbi:MAG: peptidylprolyl isomerase [candidate division WOR-3 bacterium]|nr:peptidylprolyl isomerase [candidate division WOR-3 bacterium]